MFDSITSGLTGAMNWFRGRGKLTEANIREGLEQVKRALLEADVNYDVAQSFVDTVTQTAIGQKIVESLNPHEQLYGIVYQALIGLMGPVDHSLRIEQGRVNVIMLCGLQGSGKTTTCGKLAKLLLEQGHKTMLVAADLQRPAAIEQLKTIGQQIGVPVYSEPPTSNPISVCQNGLAAAKRAGDIRVVILDTAGRLHIDDALMRELEQIDQRINPQQILFVCDAMTGQDAVNSARAFNEALELDGVILTKLDGDARGGAALSIKHVTGVPIKFIGVGEHLDKLEMFHPERMAQRVLGQGDILTLAEKAARAMDADALAKAQQEMLKGKFTLDTFRDTMRQMKRLGSMRDVMKFIPGMSQAMQALDDMNPDQDLKRIEGIIDAMTPEERNNPDLIGASRRRRIAKGSGSDPAEVSKLLRDFDEMAKLMSSMASMSMRERMAALQQITHQGLMNPDARLQIDRGRSTRPRVDVDKKKRMRKEAKAQRKKNRKKR